MLLGCYKCGNALPQKSRALVCWTANTEPHRDTSRNSKQLRIERLSPKSWPKREDGTHRSAAPPRGGQAADPSGAIMAQLTAALTTHYSCAIMLPLEVREESAMRPGHYICIGDK